MNRHGVAQPFTAASLDGVSPPAATGRFMGKRLNGSSDALNTNELFLPGESVGFLASGEEPANSLAIDPLQRIVTCLSACSASRRARGLSFVKIRMSSQTCQKNVNEPKATIDKNKG
jgi:hypothetical protein